MNKTTLRSFIVISVSLLVAFFLAKMNEPYVNRLNGFSLYFIAGVIAFMVNWIAFIPAYIFQSEHYYDITGSFTYLSLLVFAFVSGELSGNYRALILCALVSIWTLRLGMFLFSRIQTSGKDSRFDSIKPVFSRFWTAWTLQALWVFLTLSATLAVLTSVKQVPLGPYAIIGVILWLIGFAIEVIADRQKTAFKKNPNNAGRFISSGLWAHSRHPNYFGEILLWTGIFIICIPVLQGTQWFTMISPIFVFLLLKYVSGINMLEKIADSRWGGQENYENYKANTSELILMP